MNELMEKIAEEAFVDELEKIALGKKGLTSAVRRFAKDIFTKSNLPKGARKQIAKAAKKGVKSPEYATLRKQLSKAKDIRNLAREYKVTL